MKEERMRLPKVTLDDMFLSQEERDNKNREYVKIIPIREITNFPNHPYKVREDDEMFSMVQTIKEYGVIHPILVRPEKDGGYEMISGHRRKRSCQIAGITEIKAIVRDMTDEEATIAMVDSNNQREQILPSEKALAFKMKLEAMKKQGQRNDLTSAPMEQKLQGRTTRELIAEEMGESSSNIQRFIRLTELIPELLKIVDEGKMKLRPAVELSYLKKEEQQEVFDAIEYTDAFPSHPQAIKMRKLIVIIILLISSFSYYEGGNENGQKAVNIEKQVQKENAIKNDNEEKTEINTMGQIDDVIEKKEKENSIKKVSEEKQINEQAKKEKQTEIKRNTQESEKKITNTTKTEVQTKNTITVKTEETKERPKCTHTSENYYNSKTEAEAIYNAEIKKWGDKWTSNKIDIEEYSRKCPDGYEVWSCPYCNKWTIEMYY